MKWKGWTIVYFADSVFQTSKTQHEEELIIQVQSLKKKKKGKVNSWHIMLCQKAAFLHQNALSKRGYDAPVLKQEFDIGDDLWVKKVSNLVINIVC